MKGVVSMSLNSVPFTKEMKKTHTILIPYMLPIHFEMVAQSLRKSGYLIELLKTSGSHIVDEGLKHVHNDTCYPAIIVIGQMLEALTSGRYDVNRVALMITQTGGGCRASNYIYLLRKALDQSGFQQVPIISVNMSNLESNPGFKLSFPLILRLLYAVLYGDFLMCLANQCKPYEVENGSTQRLLDTWCKKMSKQIDNMSFLRLKHYLKLILKDFEALELKHEKKPKVGIVGEIYLKYAPIGNNYLEDFLIGEGVEVVLSGVMDFLLYCLQNNLLDVATYGFTSKYQKVYKTFMNYLIHSQNSMLSVLKKSKFNGWTPFNELSDNVTGFISTSVKMGEGWLLTAEMIDLIKQGVNNIVCCQPFGCLPNHIVAKGMMRKIKTVYPQSNIVPIDYDPSATMTNQENRLKLMLSHAKNQF